MFARNFSANSIGILTPITAVFRSAGFRPEFSRYPPLIIYTSLRFLDTYQILKGFPGIVAVVSDLALRLLNCVRQLAEARFVKDNANAL